MYEQEKLYYKEKMEKMDEMTSNKELAVEILRAVGGKSNISFLTHCATRLRINFEDDTIPNDDNIKKIKGVLGVNKVGDQYQIIIGPNVTEVFAELEKMIGTYKKSEQPETSQKNDQKFSVKVIFAKVMDYLSGSMAPLIPAMMAAALFRTVQTLIGPSTLNIISDTSDFYVLCDFLYNGFFYFIPIFLGYTAAKKIDFNPVLGMLAGALLLVPGFVELTEIEGASFSIYGIPAPVLNYAQSVVPIILTTPVMKLIYRFFKKIIPDMVHLILVPFLTVVVTLPLEFCLLAPLGNYLGNLVGDGLVAFGTVGGFIAIAIIAALWEFLVLTGMHQVLIVFAITMTIQNGVDFVVGPAAQCATVAAYGIALGAALRLRSKENKSLSFSYFISGIVGGLTEPALYGIGFKYKRTFLAILLGGFVGGLYAGITHVGVYMVGAANFMSVLGYANGGTGNLINGIISQILTLVVATTITYMFGFTKSELEKS